MGTWIRTAGLVLFGLLVGYATAHGGASDAAAAPSAAELDAYVQVQRVLAQNPSMTKEEIDKLLADQNLTSEAYERIDRQVQADPELKRQVQERTGGTSPGPQAAEPPAAVRTKVKPSAPQESPAE